MIQVHTPELTYIFYVFPVFQLAREKLICLQSNVLEIILSNKNDVNLELAEPRRQTMNNIKQETENQTEKNEGKVKEPRKFLQKLLKTLICNRKKTS